MRLNNEGLNIGFRIGLTKLEHWLTSARCGLSTSLVPKQNAMNSIVHIDLTMYIRLSVVEVYSRKLFRDVWQKEFPHVKVMKHDTFSKCTNCTKLTSIINNSKDPAKKAKATEARDLHWQRITTDRRAVETARNTSRHDRDFFFCEIDGMDSAKTIIPHFHTWDKNVDKKNLLKIHVTCVKYNGSQPDDMYYYTDCFPHDSANTVTMMLKTLTKVKLFTRNK